MGEAGARALARSRHCSPPNGGRCPLLWDSGEEPGRRRVTAAKPVRENRLTRGGREPNGSPAYDGV